MSSSSSPDAGNKDLEWMINRFPNGLKTSIDHLHDIENENVKFYKSECSLEHVIAAACTILDNTDLYNKLMGNELFKEPSLVYDCSKLPMLEDDPKSRTTIGNTSSGIPTSNGVAIVEYLLGRLSASSLDTDTDIGPIAKVILDDLDMLAKPNTKPNTWEPIQWDDEPTDLHVSMDASMFMCWKGPKDSVNVITRENCIERNNKRAPGIIMQLLPAKYKPGAFNVLAVIFAHYAFTRMLLMIDEPDNDACQVCQSNLEAIVCAFATQDDWWNLSYNFPNESEPTTPT